MALSFIGKPISLISHSDVRYRGILAGIDAQASTIQLSNVYSMGTESRRPPNQFISPVQDPYAYIIFRASEVKDLSVDEPAAVVAQPNVHDDPAVLGASAPAPKPAYPAYPAGTNGATPVALQGAPTSYSQQGHPSPAPATQQAQPSQPQAGPAPGNRNIQPQQQQQHGAPSTRRPNTVHTANVSLETVERALGDLRVTGGGAPVQNTHGQQQHNNHRGGRRGGHRGGRAGDAEHLKVPTTDFDFESSNAKFDKAVHSPAGTKESTDDGTQTGDELEAVEKEKEAEQPAYNPQKSFFDSLSSSAHAGPGGPSGSGGAPNHGGGGGNGGPRGRRGGGGPGMGRNRREEEREKNVATFGEPGGVGLLGPGGYVGGWGGYGRRGGRPRRGGGGGRGGGGPPPVQA